MTEDEDDVLMVSLTDALTCVLAASIALFLIFVVFAKLVPAEAQGGTLSRSKLMSRAVSEDMKAGFSTAVLRVQSTDCSLIEGLSLSISDVDDWILRDARSGDCARVFGLRAGLSSPVYLYSHKYPGQEVRAFLEVGAAYWPHQGAQTLSESGYRSCVDGRYVLLLIHQRRDDYLSHRTEGGC